ncbi:unnamed protein product [Rotaria sordida]|uniref:Uncharacterized protein n=1 Tax=Rotaria sordida TaxID=392033 RepID=A0A815J7H6_9BILA|nr:unnamed protein product [Rotaria sordida]
MDEDKSSTIKNDRSNLETVERRIINNLDKNGQQMVNHIQGEDYFTTKLQLFQSLQTYEKISINFIKRPSHFSSLNQFLPDTFKLDDKYDRNTFFNIH